MTKGSLKALLGGTAAAVLAAVAVAPGAQAATCWWAGGDWNCTTPPPPGSVIAPPNHGALAGYANTPGAAPEAGMAASFIPAPTWGFSRADYQQMWNENPNRK